MVTGAPESTNVLTKTYGPRHQAHWTSTPLCLEFTRTLIGRWNGQEKDLLDSYADLVTWCKDADLLTEVEGERMLSEGQGRPEEAADALSAVKECRETIYAVFLAIAQSVVPGEEALEELNGHIADTSSRSRIVAAGDEFIWTCTRNCDSLDRIVWPVIRSAAALLTSEDRRLIKCCASHECRVLFFDTSRNKRRRWCDMKTCGNRAKVRRHYRRKRLLPK